MEINRSQGSVCGPKYEPGANEMLDKRTGLQTATFGSIPAHLS